MKQSTLYLFILLLLSACGRSSEGQKRLTLAEKQRLKTEDSLALKIAVTPTLDALPLFVAKEQGMFERAGVDVRLRRFTAAMDCDTAFVGGSVQGMVSDMVRTERLQKRGTPIIYKASTPACWQLIANKKARLKSIARLEDRMVAMTRFSATDYLTDKAIEGVKMKTPLFKIQINDVLIRLEMLLNNEIDAMWLPEPQATTARLQHHGVLADSRTLKVSFGVLAFNKKRIESKHRQAQMAQFVRGYDAACDSINRYGVQHYRSIIQKYCKCDARTVAALPALKYRPAGAIDAAERAKAALYIKDK